MANTTPITRYEASANDRTEIIANARSIVMVTRQHMALGASHAFSASRRAPSAPAAKRRDSGHTTWQPSPVRLKEILHP